LAEGPPQTPLGGAYSAPPDLLARFEGPSLNGGRGRRGWKGKGEGRRENMREGQEG